LGEGLVLKKLLGVLVMRGKRGVFFGLYMVFITLFLCGISVVMFIDAQGKIESSLISPRVVMEVSDDLSVYEMREKELIKESCESEGGEFGSLEFIERIKLRLIEGIKNNDFMKGFITGDVVSEGRPVGGEENYFENFLYGDVSYVGGEIVIVRRSLKKTFSLRPADRYNIHFPVDFSYEFGKRYNLSKVNGVCTVEAM